MVAVVVDARVAIVMAAIVVVVVMVAAMAVVVVVMVAVEKLARSWLRVSFQGYLITRFYAI